jgi:hypothetical protein
MSADALFDLDPAQIREPEPAEHLSAQRRRTLRQADALRAGRHPLGLTAHAPLRLHADAPPADDKKAPGPRCGTCSHRDLTTSNGTGPFPKCLRGWPGGSLDQAPYASHGAATDCRAWWPACTYWEPKP